MLPTSLVPTATMTGVRDFVAGLARAGKGFKEIQETVNAAYGDLALKRGAIYSILRKVKAGKNTKDQRHLNKKKTKRTAALIAAVAAAVHKDGRIGIQDLPRPMRCHLAPSTTSSMMIWAS
jgi:hypothetical protein